MTEERTYSRRDLVVFARYMTRRGLAQQIGQTAFDGARDYYRSLGYVQGEIDYQTYRQRYDRQDVAARIIDLPAQDSWKHPPAVTESGNEKTAFVEAWQQLVSLLGVWGKLMRADKLSGIGRYGVLLLGFTDGEDLSKPVEGQFSGPKDLLYLRPFAQGMADIKTYDEDAKSPRCGQPTAYSIQIDKGTQQTVHWQRVLHLAEGKTDNEVYGTPRLQKVMNRLDDLIKVVGGAAEASWFAMRPGTLIRPQKDYELDMTNAEIEDELESYVHDPMRMLWLEGMEVQEIARPVVIDPTKAYEAILSLIATATGIPQRVLQGSAQGELAAAREDRKQWAGEISYRQKNYVEPEILRPFIERMISVGILPTAGEEGYTIGTLGDDGEWHWPSILEMDRLEDAEIARRRAAAVHSLSDPMRVYPIEDGEKRQLVGFPEERPEPAAMSKALARAIDNHREGKITAEQLVAFAVLELADV